MNLVHLFAYSQDSLAAQAAFLEQLGFVITDSSSEDYDESGSQFFTLTMQFTGIPPCPACEGACEVETGIGMHPCDECNGKGVVLP